MSNIRRKLQDRHTYTTLLFADGFDEAILGVGWAFDKPISVAYDKKKCIQILMKRDKMQKHEAEEYFSFNVEGSFVGNESPLFLEVA